VVGHSTDTDVVVVRLDDRRMALPVASVVEIFPAMECATLPNAPLLVSGVVNLRGLPVPVISLRARLGLPMVEYHPDHHVVVCSIGARRVALWVDHAEAVSSLDPASVVAADAVIALQYLDGVAVQPDGIMFVFDLQAFLDSGEASQLDAAMAELTAPASS
jgi:purine-binding chemotaxis protein CheW